MLIPLIAMVVVILAVAAYLISQSNRKTKDEGNKRVKS
jgi:preprotein translocase subunit YajC